MTTDHELEFKTFYAFCGMGAGAYGMLKAESKVLGRRARFRSLGGIDSDPLACEDFRKLTKSPCLQADIAKLTAAELRAFCPESPDCVFASSPCTGMSGLLSAAKARTAKYRKLNRLTLQWIELMLETWADDLPALFLLENVPRIATRGRHLLRKARKLLRKAGYVFHEQSFNAGQLGGLAQNRNRFLLVARLPSRVGPLLYQPPKRRVRACGEVLEKLPMPNDPAGGPLHTLPKISWLNWVRLALIPAGGDWRDLPGVLQELQELQERHDAHSGNGVAKVADPRVVPQADNPGAHWNKYAVGAWDEPAATVTGASRPGSGAPAVADPRVATAYRGTLGVLPFDEPAGVVTGNARPVTGRFSVADPRVPAAAMNDWAGKHPSKYRVRRFDEPAGTVTGETDIQEGAQNVADPRVKRAFDHGHRILRWDEPSFCVHGMANIGTGAYAVADIRVADLLVDSEPRNGAYGCLAWDEAAKTVTGVAGIDNGPWAVVDPRVPDAPPLIVIRDIRKPPSAVPVIIAKDGTWHRPLTTLELAVLQSLPAGIDGKPLTLAGTSATEHRRRIGNAFPCDAAQAIAEQMLIALTEEAVGQMLLRGDGSVWVRPASAEATT